MGYIVDTIEGKSTAQRRNRIREQGAGILFCYEPLAIDETAAAVGPGLRGRGQAGFGAVFFTSGHQCEQNNAQERFH